MFMMGPSTTFKVKEFHPRTLSWLKTNQLKKKRKGEKNGI